MSALAIEPGVEAWEYQGNCASRDPDAMFPIEGESQGVYTAPSWAEAKAICAGCPVIEQCFKENLEQPYGVWFGTDPGERKKLRRNRQLAAKRRRERLSTR